MKKFLTVIFGRVLYTLVFVAVQICALLLVLRFFQDKFVYFYVFGVILSTCVGLRIISSNMHPSYKIAWLVPIMLLPIFGGLMYLMFGKMRLSQRESALMTEVDSRYKEAMQLYGGSAPELEKYNSEAAKHSKYIKAITEVPPYCHTQTRYLPVGEEYNEVILNELEKAEKFIFLEYFIIEEGTMWNSILEILERKARAGVDVRVLYDDLGCAFTLPQFYDLVLEKKGIKACVFHRFNSILNARFNVRDHRKLCIIDGNVGMTGGINLADEYINAHQRYGHWKDSGILLKGEGVWSLTVMFLSMWDYVRREHEEFSRFAPDEAFVSTIANDGFVQPFTDTPLDNEPVGETVYLNMINRAQKYVYITTPYLIIDNEMLNAFRTAARSGVDVRLIVPGVPDKKTVYTLTSSYCEMLVAAGIRVYKYDPGFIHAKNCVSDDEYGMVGTINLDYRSLFLHYECASWMCGCAAVGQIKEDFMATLEKCTEISPESIKKRNALQRLWLAILRAFAPMM